MRFTNVDGTSTFGRYRILPEAGVEHLDAAAIQSRDANFLFDEIAQRIAADPIRFQVVVQSAIDGDVVDDATVHWPADRRLVPFGTLSLTGIAPAQEAEQKKIIFDPIPRVDGIEASDDPLLELRAAVYLLSGRKRRKQ
jgi:catalase